MPEIATATWWESKFARRLDFLAAIAALVLLCRLAREEDISWMGGVLVCAVVVLLTASRWPYGALFVLTGMSAMPVFFVEVFGWKARPEHFAAAIVLVAAGVSFFVFKHRVRFDKIDYWILAYVAVNFLSSGIASTEPSSTLRWALQNSLAVLPYFLIRFLVQDFTMFRRAFRILLIVGLVESVYGILCYASHEAFGTTAGVGIGQYLVDVAAPYGSMYEPNLFGAYTACCAVLFLACYLFGGRRHRHLICFLVASLAAVLSFSRAALLALVLTAGWVFWKGRRARNVEWKRTPAFLLAVALILVVAYTAVGGVIRERFSNLYFEGLTEETTISRLLVMQEALQDIPGHLVLGSGTASFNLSFDWGRLVPQWSGEKTWIGNAPLRILHDTGLIGITALFGFFVSVGWKVRRTWKEARRPDGLALGLVAGALLYGISFQFTDGTILAFFWVHLGFLASAAILSSGSPVQDLLTAGPSPSGTYRENL